LANIRPLRRYTIWKYQTHSGLDYHASLVTINIQQIQAMLEPKYESKFHIG